MAAPAPVGPALRLPAWAKVNLTLHVTGRRADGYHELDSLVVFAGIGDELELAPAAELALRVEGPFVAALPADGAAADNMVLRAARALRARAGVTAGARIILRKNLPVAAGLGGGSADAAAALRGLATLWSLDPAALDLPALAASLGADVPVCLVGRASFLGGIGEHLTPAPPLPPVWLVLANPGMPLSTAAVFAAYRGGFSAPSRWTGPTPTAAALAARLARCGNDLETPARRLLPEIETVLAALRATEGCLLARMSGSGATCFGLFGEAAAAEAARRILAARHPGWWLAAAPVLDSPALG